MYKRIAGALFSAAIVASLAGCGLEDPAPRTVTVISDKCWLDSINGETGPLVHVKGVVNFGGWAVDSSTNTVPAELQLFLKDAAGFSYFADISQRSDRPDVVSVFNMEGFLKSGFNLEADLSSLKPGVYAISMRMLDKHRVVICQIYKNIIVD